MQLFVIFKQVLRVKEKASEIVTPNSWYVYFNQ